MGLFDQYLENATKARVLNEAPEPTMPDEQEKPDVPIEKKQPEQIEVPSDTLSSEQKKVMTKGLIDDVNTGKNSLLKDVEDVEIGFNNTTKYITLKYKNSKKEKNIVDLVPAEDFFKDPEAPSTLGQLAIDKYNEMMGNVVEPDSPAEDPEHAPPEAMATAPEQEPSEVQTEESFVPKKYVKSISIKVPEGWEKGRNKTVLAEYNSPKHSMKIVAPNKPGYLNGLTDYAIIMEDLEDINQTIIMEGLLTPAEVRLKAIKMIEEDFKMDVVPKADNSQLPILFGDGREMGRIDISDLDPEMKRDERDQIAWVIEPDSVHFIYDKILALLNQHRDDPHFKDRYMKHDEKVSEIFLMPMDKEFYDENPLEINSMTEFRLENADQPNTFRLKIIQN